MDITELLKTLNTTINKFLTGKNEFLYKSLHKQLDILIDSLTDFKYQDFDPRNVLAASCVTGFCTLLNFPETDPLVLQKVLTVINTLVTNQYLGVALQATVDLNFVLGTFLNSIIHSRSDPVFFQCLEVMQNVSAFGHLTNVFHSDVSRFIIHEVRTGEGPMFQPCLRILANLCRNSPTVCKNIKATEPLKPFLKSMLLLIRSSKNHTVVISALSVIVSISVTDECVESFFKQKNVELALELLFNMLVNGSVFHQYVAVDVFLDFLSNPKVGAIFQGYRHLQTCINRIMDQISLKNVGKILQLFSFYLTFPPVEKILMTAVLAREKDANASIISTAIESLSLKTPSGLQQAESVLSFLVKTFKFDADCECILTTHSEKLINVIVRHLTEGFDSEDLSAKWHSIRMAKEYELLKVLVELPQYTAIVSNNVNFKLCQETISFQFEKNAGLKEYYPHFHAAIDWSQNGINVVLHCVSFIVVLARNKSFPEDYLKNLFQCEDMLSALAFALTTEDYGMTEMAFKFLKLGLISEELSLRGISKRTVHAMSKKSKPDDMRTVKNDVAFCQNGVKRLHLSEPSPVKSKDNDVEFKSLLRRVESSLQHGDLKKSDILQLYEHEIKSLRIAENQLRDLLEIKSATLQQADCLHAQDRCRLDQTKAESLKLLQLLEESQKANEETKRQVLKMEEDLKEFCKRYNETVEELSASRTKQAELLNELEQAVTDIEVLQKEVEDRNDAHAELEERLETSKRSQQILEQEHKTTLELNAMLQMHNESYKQKQELLTSQVSDLESEKKTLGKHMKETESKLRDATKSLQKSEDLLQQKKEALRRAEESSQSFQSSLTVAEKENATLKQKVSSLEEANGTMNKQLQEAQEQYSSCAKELDKYRSLLSAIQNLSTKA